MSSDMRSVPDPNKKLRCCCDSRSYIRTAYDVQYARNLSNWFRLQVDKRLARTIRFNVYIEMNATKLNALKRDWLKFTKSVNNIAERNTTNARLIVCLRETRVRVFFDSFLPHDALNFS